VAYVKLRTHMSQERAKSPQHSVVYDKPYLSVSLSSDSIMDVTGQT